MYGEEGSAYRLANLQDRDPCPYTGPWRGHGLRTWCPLGSFCRSARARLCCEDKDAQGRGPWGPRSPSGWWFAGAGAVGGGPPGAGPWVIQSCWALRKAGLPWSRLDRECWWRWSCVTALAGLINKAACAAEFPAGSRSGIEGDTRCLAERMREAAPAVQKAGEPVNPGSLVSPHLDGCGVCLPLPPVGPRFPNFPIGPR